MTKQILSVRADQRKSVLYFYKHCLGVRVLFKLYETSKLTKYSYALIETQYSYFWHLYQQPYRVYHKHVALFFVTEAMT